MASYRPRTFASCAAKAALEAARAMPAQAPLPTITAHEFSLRPGCGDEPVGANRAAVGEPQGARRPTPVRVGVDRRRRVRDDWARRLLFEPSDDGDTLFRARSRRHLSHRRGVAR